ncbi:competence/damage-inducible protein A [candidate division WOR-3 bacterium]|uniref:CinA-like protein n=1 Tax=candidate division WOR-3 bacterium TaxID=2052148 RepID=A0A9D5K863_UNCW3|nr:competence/damage-inducible protein A [candidate division WOR-3 bacterium]MBD3363920.1 competence/damage-inducible protein A [candidate division WOR-3 bacterium]
MTHTNAELVIIGDEILSGSVQDANTPYLASYLKSLGINVLQVTFAPDEPVRLKEIITKALERSSFVITCGGLGPTSDDYTRAVAAMIFNRRLRRDERYLKVMKRRYQRLGRKLSEMGETQADIPEGADLLTNPVGAAPGLILTNAGRTLVCLPGVPREVRVIAAGPLADWFCQNYPQTSTEQTIFLRTVNTVETELARLIEPVLERHQNVKVSYLPQVGAVDLSFSPGSDALLIELRQVLGDTIFTEDHRSLTQVVGEMLRARGETLAIAESVAGGLLTSRVVDVPGCSDYLLGGIVAYSNDAKKEFLGVSSDILAKHGAVSEQVARAMAEGVCARFKATYGLSNTGIAGPGGGTRKKPVGLVYIGLASSDGANTVKRYVFPSDRAYVRERTAVTALDMLRRHLLSL